MAPLTDNTPKPMLKVLDKNLIEWKLEAFPKEITNIVIVVGYKKEVIQDYFGSSWKGLPITYVEQITLDGTGGAIILCEPYIKDKAIVLMGDDIYAQADLEELAKYDYAILVHDEGEQARTKKGQVLEKDGLYTGLNEGKSQTTETSTYINAAAYSISKEYFNYPPVPVSETEYGLPHTLLSVTKDHPVHVVHATQWIQITTPECLQNAEELLS